MIAALPPRRVPSVEEVALTERICIGLFALYDDLSIESAEQNWRDGNAYGAEGSDANKAIRDEAAVIYSAIMATIERDALKDDAL